MGRPTNPGLSWHRQHGWYKRYKSDPSDQYGKPKYFGGKESTTDAALPQKKRQQAEQRRKETSRADAEQRWHAYEASLLGSIIQPIIAPTVNKMFDVFDILQRQRAAELALTGAKTAEDVAEIRQKLQTGLSIPDSPAAPHPTGDGIRSAPTVQDVIDAYLGYAEQHTGRQNLIDAHAKLPRFAKFVGATTPIWALKKEQFKDYRDSLYAEHDKRREWEKTQPKPIPRSLLRKAPGLSADTVNKFLVKVRDAFKIADREKSLSAPGLLSHIRILKKRTSTPTDRPVFSPDDVAALLTGSLKWRSIVTVGLNMAASNVDISEMRWHHLRLDERLIDYPRGKNEQPRRVPMWDRTADILSEYRKSLPKHRRQPDQLVFVTRGGGSYISYSTGKKTGKLSKTDNLSQDFRKTRKRLKLSEHFSFGTIRKTTATVGTGDGETVTMVLGDATSDIWRRYRMAVPESVRHYITSVETALFPPPKSKGKTTAKSRGKK